MTRPRTEVGRSAEWSAFYLPEDTRTRTALADLLLCMADDEFVIGFSDSEWTGIAPILEEDVAMSSIAQDELGHARALYELLAGVLDDGRDADPAQPPLGLDVGGAGHNPAVLVKGVRFARLGLGLRRFRGVGIRLGRG